MKDTTSEKAALIQKAALIALWGNALLAGLKLFAGIRAKSLAVTGDGMDSSIDVLIALMSLIVGRIISRPADPGHPWGHGRAETLATAALAFLLFIAGGGLILNACKVLISPEAREIPTGAAAAATVVSIGGKLLLAWSQAFFGKKANSTMLKANAKNMAADVAVSLAALLGAGLSMIFREGKLDSVAAGLVGGWIIKSAIGIFMETNVELMDGSPGRGPYQQVFDAVRATSGAGNPHRTRMRRIAGLWAIDLDIEVDPALTVLEAHRIASRVEEEIKRRLEGGVYDIMVHIEPAGNHEEQADEGYGLQEEKPNS